MNAASNFVAAEAHSGDGHGNQSASNRDPPRAAARESTEIAARFGLSSPRLRRAD
jgi:hypothetical protein